MSTWNLDAPIWDGRLSYPEIRETGDAMSFAPGDPIADVRPQHERGTLEPVDEASFGRELVQAIVEGRMNVQSPRVALSSCR